jgi:hypothetical protein
LDKELSLPMDATVPDAPEATAVLPSEPQLQQDSVRKKTTK